MKIKITFVLLNLIIAFSLLCSFVSAFGARPSFYQYVELVPGETKEIYFSLQNYAGPSTISLKPTLSENPVIKAEITNPLPYYTLEVGTEQNVYIKMSAPPDAVIGEEHILGFVITTVTPGEKGVFGFGTSISQSIPVRIISGEPPKVEEPIQVEVKQEKPMNRGILIAAIVLMIGIIVTLLIRKKNSKSSKNNKKRKK